MPTATLANGFYEHVAEQVHDLGADQLAVALSNTAPGSETSDPTGATADCVLANVTQIAYTNLSSRNITTAASAQTAGVYQIELTDLTLTASGGSVGPFRYIYIYNDTPTSPADAIIGVIDYGSGLTLADGESLTLDFSAVNGFIRMGAGTLS